MSRPPSSKFFLEDVVRRRESGEEDGYTDIAIVLRHWHDSDPATHPEELRDDPLNRALKPGEIGVSNLISGEHSIELEADFELADRSFQPGDLVKRKVNDVISGVVIDSAVQVKVEHAISGASIEGWLSADELEPAIDVFIGDYIIYDDWVGQVEEIFDEAIAQLPTGDLFRFAELGGRYQVGDRGSDILPESSIRQSQLSVPDGFEDITLLQVKPTVLAISWLALNQALPRIVAENRQRPKTFWTSNELQELILVRPKALFRVGERVSFRNASVAEMHGLKNTRHGSSDTAEGVVEVDTLIVRDTRTTIRILWQDGMISANVPATDVIPYANVDEYDCWPGDYVLWKGEDEDRAGVVQFANNKERTAQVYWRTPSIHPSSSFATVSVLELDPHGTATQTDSPDCIGVRRGDFVFIHPPGLFNGLDLPRIPKIGEPEPWVRDMSPNGWRHELAHVGMDYAERNDNRRDEVDMKVHWKNPAGLDWFGEVTNLKSSGDIEITHPSGAISSVPLERLTLLMDSMSRENVGLWTDDDLEAEEEQQPNNMPSILSMAGVPIHQLENFFFSGANEAPATDSAMGDDAQEDAESSDNWDSFVDADSNSPSPKPLGPEGDDAMEIDEPPPPPPTIAAPVPQYASSSKSASPPGSGSSDTSTSYLSFKPSTPTHSTFRHTPIPTPPSTNSSTPSPPSIKPPSLNGDDVNESWQRFAILSSAPPDHAFYNSKPGSSQASRTFMTRLTKEYKVLSSSLPETILVRAYEDRVDLLRSMIIGPENTPYEGAPFVIDWYLEDTFPTSPPHAHFHSWTNGNGRVNPNLYEEGKVCLSILGTWAGDKSESWSPSRSSLLQALVSIQGLVLVKEPWFCEPAFEKLRGTEEACVNSRLYSEKAYVLSRGFVRRALEVAPMGLEREIEYHYVEQGKLESLIHATQELIQESEKRGAADVVDSVPGWEDKAIPKLTPGAILPLKRTLAKLETLLAARKGQTVEGQ